MREVKNTQTVYRKQMLEELTDGTDAALMREEGCDFVLALGGGSVMDCAKCIALMANNDGHIWDYSQSGHGGKQTPANPALPIVCITTSSGTASEVDRGAVISKLCHPMAEMFALKSIELVSRYLPRAVRDGSDSEAREMMAYARSFAGYYMLCTSGHRIEHAMGSFHEDLPHGAGLILTAHAYYDFLAEKQAAEDKLVRMAKTMGKEDASSGKDFVAALDQLIADVGCADMKMSDWGITEAELELYPPKIHHVLGGNINADPVPISDEAYLDIYRKAYA